MSRMIAHVDGLLYEHSVVGLAAQIGRRAGIRRVAVDAASGRVTILYDATRVSARELPRLIVECGYDYRGCETSAEGPAPSRRGDGPPAPSRPRPRSPGA